VNGRLRDRPGVAGRCGLFGLWFYLRRVGRVDVWIAIGGFENRAKGRERS